MLFRRHAIRNLNVAMAWLKKILGTQMVHKYFGICPYAKKC